MPIPARIDVAEDFSNEAVDGVDSDTSAAFSETRAILAKETDLEQLQVEQSFSKVNSLKTQRDKGSFTKSIRDWPRRIFKAYWDNYVLLALTGALNLSLNLTCLKIIAEKASSFQASAIRGLVDSLILFLLCRWKGIPILEPRDKLIYIILRGITGSTAFICFGLAGHLLPLSEASFLSNSYPVVTSLLSWSLGMEQLSILSWLGVAGCFIGNALVARPPIVFRGHTEWGIYRLLGITFAFLNALLLGWTFIVIKQAGENVSPLALTLYMQIFCVLFTLPVSLAGFPRPISFNYSFAELASYVWLCFSGVALLSAMTRAFQIGSPSKTTSIFMTNMLISAAIGWFFFSESLSWISLLGASVITVSVVTVVTQRTKKINTYGPIPKDNLDEIELAEQG